MFGELHFMKIKTNKIFFISHLHFLFSLKTIQLEKLKLRILNQVENADAEEKCLSEYRRELELLMQEKMSHVEELRQIHADINAVS
jgi:hypothetical protein